MVTSKKQYRPGFRSAALKVEIHHFNIDALRKIRDDAMTRESHTSYVVPAKAVLANAAGVRGNVVVLPLNGISSAELDYEEPNMCSAVHPNLNGDRIACLMLAGEKVALTHMAPHWAGASLYDDLRVLWIFDDAPVISQHYISDDILEQMNETNAIEGDHECLTPEELMAWKKVAAEAKHIGFFEVVDITDTESPLRDAILND
ncbi:hypothetical protein [Paraburkholderia flagellata]|uniref:hypothetical protein n=1 Tax=Paraburkholderia flagellata TaxID=2883241 RepID=UPI001F41B91F|nr:hypothetical protein [Paraburkholderia flagellata]